MHMRLLTDCLLCFLWKPHNGHICAHQNDAYSSTHNVLIICGQACLPKTFSLYCNLYWYDASQEGLCLWCVYNKYFSLGNTRDSLEPHNQPERSNNKDKETNKRLRRERERNPRGSWLMVESCSQFSEDFQCDLHLFSLSTVLSIAHISLSFYCLAQQF